MSWARFDDQMLDNEKIIHAGPAAFAMHVAGILYCARNLTDGFIPAAKVRTLLDWSEIKTPVAKILARLTDCKPAPLWRRDEERDGYLINDYLDYNPSRAEVLSQRDSARMRQGKHRMSQRDIGVTSPEVPAKSAVNSDAPVPVPVPVPEEQEHTHGGGRDLVVVPNPSDVCPRSGVAPIAMRCNPALEATPGMLAALRADGCLDPEAEVRLYALKSHESNRRHIDWTETGPIFPLWLHRHGRQMPCAGRQRAKPRSVAKDKQARSFEALDRAAATLEERLASGGGQ